MKKIIVLLLVLLSTTLSFAQQLPPTNCVVNNKNAATLIANYQEAAGANRHPSSFIMNTSALKTYLANSNPNNEIYLHIYLAYDAGNVVQLIIVPSFLYSGSLNYILMHDVSSSVIFSPCMDEKTKNNGFCYVSDLLDDLDQYNAACNLNTTCPPISKATAKTMIANYQATHTQITGHLQSFTFSANYLRSLLTNPQNNIPYLQIYFGLDPQLTSNPEFYNTLVFVGLNANGTHIYVKGGLFGTISEVYEECMPCPQCGVMIDPAMDNQPQVSQELEHRYENCLRASINEEKQKGNENNPLIIKYQDLLDKIKKYEK